MQLIISLLLSSGAIIHADPPYVLFIAIEDLNDEAACLEYHPQVKTPNMNAPGARVSVKQPAPTKKPALLKKVDAAQSIRVSNTISLRQAIR